MSDHDELADKREAEANYMEAAAEHNEDQAEKAREALSQAQRDEFVPAPMGEDDPAHRESSDDDDTPPPEDEEDPASPRA